MNRIDKGKIDDRGNITRVGGHQTTAELDGVEGEGGKTSKLAGGRSGEEDKQAIRKAVEQRREEKKEKMAAEVEEVLGKDEMEKKKGVNGAFAVLPEGVGFASQERDEEIVLLMRKHWFTNMKWVGISLLLSILPGAFWLLPVWPGAEAFNYKLMLSLLWYLLVSAYVVEGALGWLFNVYIVTTDRIVDIDFYNVLHREVSEAEFEKIQDVTVRTGGFWAAIFNYADILIQTAAEKAEFEFLAVPHAEKVAQIIRDLTEAEEEDREA
jgi:hypothetical protein